MVVSGPSQSYRRGAALGRKQPLLMVSGECPLYTESSRWAAKLVTGCF